MSELRPLIDYRPFGKKILVRKGTTGKEELHDGRVYHRLGNIVVTDLRADHQHWCEILDVSPKCEFFNATHVGGWVHLPEVALNHMYRVSEQLDDWIVRESLFDEGAPLCVLFTEEMAHG